MLKLLISDEDMQYRKENIPIKISAPARGYGKLFFDHVMQAPQGVDFDFLVGVDADS